MTARILPHRFVCLMLWTSVCGLSFPLSALAHVGLDAPVGGEQLVAGSVFEIEWNPMIPHDTFNWDLFYSTNSSNGPWTTIALNLPLGNNSAGSPHFYNWTVPNIVDPSVWVRVFQDNNGEDYDDVSGSFAIVAASLLGDYDGSGTLGEGDFLKWRNTFNSVVPAGTQADGNGNGRVDAADYAVWRDAVSAGSGTGTQAIAIPEPAANALLLLATVLAAAMRRAVPRPSHTTQPRWLG